MGIRKRKNENFRMYRARIEREYYKTLEKNPIYCPALGKRIHFTKEGWEHIAGIQKDRHQVEVYKRIYLLRYVRSILKRSGTVQDVRRIGKVIYYRFQSIEMLERFLNGEENFKKVKVIVRTKKTGKPVFYSVMD